MPRTPRRLAALLLAGATLASLAACAPAEPEPTSSLPVESAADEPIFASDEEALAAAVAAYEAYLDVEQSITGSDQSELDSIREVTTAQYAEELVEQYSSIRESSLRMVGRGKIDAARLAEQRTDGDATHVSIYACSDISGVRIVDSSGSDVTPERKERVPVQISFEQQGASPLLVAGSSTWSGDDFC
ncbi:hypothetical protein BCL57_001472 [Agromyces flavus]|uniref:Lipoprotein n=1 Tax=Agromyces flavus TaxID=589382 RepID=A0A1H1ZX38_9MICO|nr:hypothetical protein [Agromyces flavus]MCP2367318.1 hypothetical protein [Agromyces flavus]GGI45967.1 hypothetical protein GCM10010932_12230 [Agromyces flavus]SDT38274.1 hypothetical protein SAMN04489721_3396 [Agromyces flavus]